jgi:prepilin-type N-terminal cleavage/methylation domain-containing protein
MRSALSVRRPALGFTMVELVVVIIILGVLAAVAIPRFVDLRGKAEQSAITSWVGALKSAYGLAHASGLVNNYGYTSPYQMSLFNITRCDRIEQIVEDPNRPKWMGHHMALAPLRDSVFANPDEQACSGQTITFTTSTDRVVTITNSSNGVTWSATPAY